MRKSVINIIIAEVAKHGKETEKSLRMYVENRISYSVYKNSVKIGIDKFNGKTII